MHFRDSKGREYEIERITLGRYYRLRDRGFDLLRWASTFLKNAISAASASSSADTASQAGVEAVVGYLLGGIETLSRNELVALLEILCEASLRRHGATASAVLDELSPEEIWVLEEAMLARFMDFFGRHPIGEVLQNLLEKRREFPGPRTTKNSSGE